MVTIFFLLLLLLWAAPKRTPSVMMYTRSYGFSVSLIFIFFKRESNYSTPFDEKSQNGSKTFAMRQANRNFFFPLFLYFPDSKISLLINFTFSSKFRIWIFGKANWESFFSEMSFDFSFEFFAC